MNSKAHSASSGGVDPGSGSNAEPIADAGYNKPYGFAESPDAAEQQAAADPNTGHAAVPLTRWPDLALTPVNADFATRVVCLVDQLPWCATDEPGLEIALLEYLPDQTRGEHGQRLDTVKDRTSGTALLRSVAPDVRLPDIGGTELLIIRGQIHHPNGLYPTGLYLREPLHTEGPNPLGRWRLQPDPLDAHSSRPSTSTRKGVEGSPVSTSPTLPGALMYATAGQFGLADTESRRIDTLDTGRWLPGPVEGTEVLPLHVHGTSSAMMIRWQEPVSFRPRLDPLGEEVLVVQGILHDAHGDYPAGSWIRNPVLAWQSWSGEPGTVVFYKNGHFMQEPDSNQTDPNQTGPDLPGPS